MRDVVHRTDCIAKAHKSTKEDVEEMKPLLTLTHSNSALGLEQTASLREDYTVMREQLEEVQEQVENQGGQKIEELEQGEHIYMHAYPIPMKSTILTLY